MYKLLPIDDDKLNVDNYFCGECRSILHIKHSSNTVCPNCGLKYDDYSYNNNESNPQEIRLDWVYDVYHVNDMIDSVTINKGFNEDGSIKDINVTILYHSYKIAHDLQKSASWQHYDRILFNFETKQIYYTDKVSLSKKTNFQHFKLHQASVTNMSKFSVAIQSVIREIYYEYNIPCNRDSWWNATPENMKSSVIAFMCLKFPIMMNYAYDLWTSYERKFNSSCVVDIHISMIYWTCNYDRVLKKALMSTTEQEYIERTDAIMQEITDNDSVLKSARNNPLYVVYARYMHQLGFTSFSSVERIVDYVSRENAQKTDISIWILDMLSKRTHIRNKMYRRLLKVHEEDALLDMFLASNYTDTYLHFFSSSSQRAHMNVFYNQLEMCMESVDFSNDINDIFSDLA